MAVDPAGVKKAGSGAAGGGGLHDGAGAAGQGNGMDAAELGGDAPPGGAAAPFADTHQQEGEPAQQQHVSADAGLDAVEHGPQLEGGREVPEPAFGFEQVLVAEGPSSAVRSGPLVDSRYLPPRRSSRGCQPGR